MANVQITIPDAIVPRLTSAARGTYTQYSALTDAQLFKKVTADFWRSVLSSWEGGVAAGDVIASAAAARATAVSNADAASAGIG